MIGPLRPYDRKRRKNAFVDKLSKYQEKKLIMESNKIS
jgi:hypothetical protein